MKFNNITVTRERMGGMLTETVEAYIRYSYDGAPQKEALTLAVEGMLADMDNAKNDNHQRRV